MARSHYYRPITDDQGDLVANIAVRLLNPGTTTSAGVSAYAGPTGSAVYTQPWTIANGIIDFYLEAPKRLQIGVLAPTLPEAFLDNEDVLPPADQILVSPVPFVITNAPAANSVLVATGPGSGYWKRGIFLRSTATFLTAALAPGAGQVGLITLSPSYHLLKLSVSGPARVRLYTTADKRDADLARAIGTDPIGDHGLCFEFIGTTDQSSVDCAPSVTGGSTETVPVEDIAISVTNLSDVTAAVTVTAIYTGLE